MFRSDFFAGDLLDFDFYEFLVGRLTGPKLESVLVVVPEYLLNYHLLLVILQRYRVLLS